MRAVVTGSEGFIGSHLTEALVHAGHEVRAFVWYNSFDRRGWLDTLDPDVMDHVEVVMGDVRDRRSIGEAVRGRDTVFHLAALIGIPYSYVAPDNYVQTNMVGTLNVLEAARDHGVGRVVHTSTSEVYGSAQRVPIDEAHPLNAQSPYAATKIGADQLARSYFAAFGTPVTILRPFNTYGPRQSTRAIIPTIITQIAAGTRTLRLGNITPTRDLTFVTDTAAAFVAAAAADAALGEVVNAGTGHEIAIGDLVHLIASLMGVEVTIETDEARVRPAGSEVDRLLADNEKARRLLSWQPEYAGAEGLRAGLHQTIGWFTEAANLARYRSGEYTV